MTRLPSAGTRQARAVRSPAKAGYPAIFARKHAAATAIDALDEACPASCTSARQAATAASWSCAAFELRVEPPERPGVGSPRVRADGGLHQAPRGLCRPYRSRPLRGHPCCCGNATAFWPSSVVPVIDPRPGGSLPDLPCRVALRWRSCGRCASVTGPIHRALCSLGSAIAPLPPLPAAACQRALRNGRYDQLVIRRGFS